MSFICIGKNRGLAIDPCGTPFLIKCSKWYLCCHWVHYYMFSSLLFLRSHGGKSSGSHRSSSRECSSLPRHEDLHPNNDSFLNGNMSAAINLSPTLHPKNYQPQIFNHSTACSMDLASSNLPHLLSPGETKSKGDFEMNLGSKVSDGPGAKYLKSNFRSQQNRHSFVEGKTNTLQSGDKHSRHNYMESHSSTPSSSKFAYLNLSKSYGTLSDAKSVGNLNDVHLYADETTSRYFPSSCLDLTAPGSPAARRVERLGPGTGGRGSMRSERESNTLDSSYRRSSTRHKTSEESKSPDSLDPGESERSHSHSLSAPHDPLSYGQGYTSPFSSQQRPHRHSMYVRRDHQRTHGGDEGLLVGQGIPTRASSLQLLSPQLQHRTLPRHSGGSSREEDMSRVSPQPTSKLSSFRESLQDVIITNAYTRFCWTALPQSQFVQWRSQDLFWWRLKTWCVFRFSARSCVPGL